MSLCSMYIQGSAKRWSPGLVNFVTAVAYHLYLALPAAFTQPGDHHLAESTFFVQNISRFPIHNLTGEKRDSGIPFHAGTVI